MDILSSLNFLNFFSTQTFLDTISKTKTKPTSLSRFLYLCHQYTCGPHSWQKKSKHYKQFITIFMGILAFSRNLSCCTILGIKSTASPKGPWLLLFLQIEFGLWSPSAFHHLSVKGPLDFSLHLTFRKWQCQMIVYILYNWKKTNSVFLIRLRALALGKF